MSVWRSYLLVSYFEPDSSQARLVSSSRALEDTLNGRSPITAAALTSEEFYSRVELGILILREGRRCRYDLDVGYNPRTMK